MNTASAPSQQQLSFMDALSFSARRHTAGQFSATRERELDQCGENGASRCAGEPCQFIDGCWRRGEKVEDGLDEVRVRLVAFGLETRRRRPEARHALDGAQDVLGVLAHRRALADEV